MRKRPQRIHPEQRHAQRGTCSAAGYKMSIVKLRALGPYDVRGPYAVCGWWSVPSEVLYNYVCTLKKNY